MPTVDKARSTAFTLIELLVVVFIIGILIAATLTIVPKVKQKVYETQTQAQLSAIANAIQQYYNDFRAYPGPLPNNQICYGIDSTASPAISFPPYIPDPSNPSNSLPLTPITTLTSPPFLSTDNIPTAATMNAYYVTGSQNLVLGLLGGLEIASTNGAAPFSFVYNAQDIFSDGVTPAPRGAASLNYSNPKRQQAYLQVKSGDLSVPSKAYNGGAGAGFQDEAGRTTMTKSSISAMQPTGAPYAEAMIPVFLDKYSNPLPILYYRTNPGGTAIVGFRNQDAAGSGGQPLVDQAILNQTNNKTAEVAQYDLNQNLPYTCSAIGTITKNPSSYHGLIGLTSSSNMTNQYLIADSTSASPPTDPIDYNVNGYSVPTNQGANGINYFKDPTLNTTTYGGMPTSPANTHLGVARQKDGYILISAGPDRLYGTHDDTVFPGPLQP